MPARWSAFTIPLNSRTGSGRRGVAASAARDTRSSSSPSSSSGRGRARKPSSAMWCTGSSSTAVTPSDFRYAIAVLAREAAVRAAQVLAHAVAPLREALHVHLVDHRLVPRGRGRTASSSSQSNDGSITTDFGIAGARRRTRRSSRSASSSPLGGRTAGRSPRPSRRRRRSPSRTGRSAASRG